MWKSRCVLAGFAAILAMSSCDPGEDPEEDAAADGDVDADSDVDSDADTDGDVDADVDADVDGDIDGDTDSDVDSDVDGDSDADPPPCDTTVHDGVVTYYDADGSGNCSFPASPGDLMVAAMNHPEYEGSYACGACVRIDGPLGSTTVRIVDRCPECLAGHVDLSVEAFDAVARREDGRVDVTWTYVPCEVDGPIRYHFKEGSNPWWTAMQVRNHRHRIDRFEVLEEGGAWREVPRLDYNFFVADWGLGEGPYTFRVTDEHGQTLTDSGITFIEGGEVPGVGQFPRCE